MPFLWVNSSTISLVPFLCLATLLKSTLGSGVRYPKLGGDASDAAECDALGPCTESISSLRRDACTVAGAELLGAKASRASSDACAAGCGLSSPVGESGWPGNGALCLHNPYSSSPTAGRCVLAGEGAGGRPTAAANSPGAFDFSVSESSSSSDSSFFSCFGALPMRSAAGTSGPAGRLAELVLPAVWLVSSSLTSSNKLTKDAAFS
jgi:hypothetical protein